MTRVALLDASTQTNGFPTTLVGLGTQDFRKNSVFDVARWAIDCRQRGGMSSSAPSQGREPPAKIGFVGWNALEPENDQSESPLLLEEDLDHHFGDTTASMANPTCVVTSLTGEPSVLSVDESSFVGASLQD